LVDLVVVMDVDFDGDGDLDVAAHANVDALGQHRDYTFQEVDGTVLES
jgi:hypothetical protein